MTVALKITTGVLAVTVVAAGALIGGLALLVATRERKIQDAEEWDHD